MQPFLSFLSSSLRSLKQFLRWLLISTAAGAVVGSVSVLFNYGMQAAGNYREAHPWLLLCLPPAGLLIVFLYRAFHYENNAGTDTVIESIHNAAHIPLKMAGLIFVSTILTVLCGGSVGREGAAVQIGGSIGKQLGERFRLRDKEKRILLMSGISAAFSALFGTPMAAAFLAMEVAHVGIMYYTALVPCVWSAFVSYMLAIALGSPMDHLEISQFTPLQLPFSLHVLLLATLCAAVSILFCQAIHTAKQLFSKYIANPYLRALAGGFAVILLTLALRTTDYLGPGMHLIELSLEGQVIPPAFLLKILFTAITIGAGFKGGEIVPSFVAGATFGSLYAAVTGINAPLGAALGMLAVFCGVTNCPVTALLIGLELFGFDHACYFLIAVAVSYMLSGPYSLYHSQKILHQKIEHAPKSS